MSAPKPPVAFRNHCSVIHDGVIYVYSPDAFQTLELEEGGKWKEETNGVSVTGAVCVKGNVDGDHSQAALYVVGGVTNASTTDYTGIQRYSFEDKSWHTLVPVVNVTQNRLNHGAAYLDTSSTLVVYGGSQNGDNGPTSETFTISLYPPYSVLAYSSSAPPTVSPFMLPWSQNRTLMVGGSTTNDKTFTFDPINGWVDIGLQLPTPPPDHSAAQCALYTLADGSKILQTFDLGQSPPTITTDVLLNPGGAPATFGGTVGASSTISNASPTPTPPTKAKRQTSINNYPTYNNTLAPMSSQTGFNLAQGDDGLVALIGGGDNPVVFFNQSSNGWVAASQFLGTQQPLATPSSTPRGTSLTIPTSTSSSTALSTPVASSGHKSQGLTILGAVLGGVCGFLAILLLLLLYLRLVRRKRMAASQKQEELANDKKREPEYNWEEKGLGPLALAGQPMGRSPHNSAYIPQADTTGMLGAPRQDPSTLIRRVSSDKIQAGYRGSGIGFGQALFKREKEKEKHNLTISKPMMPVLNDYKERPSIELGKATPASGPAAALSPPQAAVARKTSQRKTDEGWGKYFQAERRSGSENRTTYVARSSGQASGFWAGSGNPEDSTRSPKFMLRDSVGNPLDTQNVAAMSPSLEHGPANAQSRGLQSVQGVAGHISRASSRTTDLNDGDYEDDQVVEGAFSSGIPASVQEMAWTPVGNTWSGPSERPLHPPSSYVAAQQAQAGLGIPQTRPSAVSTNTGSTSDNSSIPSFPMPNSIRSVQSSTANPPAAIHHQVTYTPYAHKLPQKQDYFGHIQRKPSVGRSQPENTNNLNTDMSWLNLGTPSSHPTTIGTSTSHSQPTPNSRESGAPGNR